MKNQRYSFFSARGWWWLAIASYTLSLSLLAVWSFSLTDPNLVFTSWAPYWQTQTWLWQNIYANPVLQARLYVLLVSLVIASYGFLIFIFKRHPVPLESGSASTTSNKHLLIALAFILLPLIFSYNALSHDMFNYLFNAKMVVVYQANPHVQVALDFPQDEWTRFMHNTHTPAPYWYGWTGISLIPFLLGLGKFTMSWWLFRLFSVLSWVSLWWSWRKWGQWRGQPVSSTWMLTIALLPLMLIEIIANGHNDLWMLIPAIISLGMILYRKLGWQTILGSIALLAFSISIKYATAVLIPLWILVAISRFLAPFNHYLIRLSPLIGSILLFIPLLTTRSQQFLPWYLTWSLVWIPLFAWNFRQSSTDRVSTKLTFHRLNAFIITFTKIWTACLLGLSISALFRYVPLLLAGGEYSKQLLTQQKWILWCGGLMVASLLFIGSWVIRFNTKTKLS